MGRFFREILEGLFTGSLRAHKSLIHEFGIFIFIVIVIIFFIISTLTKEHNEKLSEKDKRDEITNEPQKTIDKHYWINKEYKKKEYTQQYYKKNYDIARIALWITIIFSICVTASLTSYYFLSYLPKEKEAIRIMEQKKQAEKEWADRERVEQTSQNIAAESWFNKSEALLKDGKYTDPEKAIEYLSEAIRLKPDYAQAYYLRGVVYWKLNQLQRAIEDFDEAIRLKPDYALLYDARGAVYLRMGDTVHGCSDARKACSMGSCKTYELAQKRKDCR